MAINFIGIPLFILFVVSILIALVGIIRKNKKIITISIIMLLGVLMIYAILYFVFH
jgi:hypothetical protein